MILDLCPGILIRRKEECEAKPELQDGRVQKKLKNCWDAGSEGRKRVGWVNYLSYMFGGLHASVQVYWK